jgi:hypothetical protein
MIERLTKKNRAGNLYYRDARVNAAIQGSSGLSEAELTSLANIQDTRDPKHLPSEVFAGGIYRRFVAH